MLIRSAQLCALLQFFGSVRVLLLFLVNGVLQIEFGRIGLDVLWNLQHDVWRRKRRMMGGEHVC